MLEIETDSQWYCRIEGKGWHCPVPTHKERRDVVALKDQLNNDPEAVALARENLTPPDL